MNLYFIRAETIGGDNLDLLVWAKPYDEATAVDLWYRYFNIGELFTMPDGTPATIDYITKNEFCYIEVGTVNHEEPTEPSAVKWGEMVQIS